MAYVYIALGVVFFVATTYGAIAAGKRICRHIEPFADGPPPGEPPVRWMAACAAVVGLLLGLHGMQPVMLLIAAIFSGCLMGAWYCDTRCGIIPDWFTVAPLIVVLVWAAINQNFMPFAGSAALFLPFGFSAFRSKGIGMGWGDAKLVALAGAFLGLEQGLLSTVVACIVMLVYAKATKRSHEPIAFAPFLVVCFEAGLGLLPP